MIKLAKFGGSLADSTLDSQEKGSNSVKHIELCRITVIFEITRKLSKTAEFATITCKLSFSKQTANLSSLLVETGKTCKLLVVSI